MAKISVKLPETIVNRLKHQELAQGGEKKYSVCSLVVPRLEEAILTSVLKKNFKRP